MGLWVDTTYLATSDPQTVIGALTRLVAEEGMRPIAPPSERTRLLVEPMQYEPALFNDLWGVAIFPGASGWTVIQSAPLALLGERAPGAPAMRLAALCRTLAIPAFQYHLYDGSDVVLVEVTADGVVHLSGINTQSPDPFTWNNERIGEDDYEAGFRVLPLQDALDPPGGDAQAASIAQRFGGANARWCDNLVSVDTLISHKRFAAPGGLVQYFAWRGPTRQRYAPLASWDEWRALNLS